MTHVFLYLSFWYFLCDIHVQISTVVLKTKSKIINIYLKDVLQQKKKNLSLHLNNEVELTWGQILFSITARQCHWVTVKRHWLYERKGRVNEHGFGSCLFFILKPLLANRVQLLVLLTLLLLWNKTGGEKKTCSTNIWSWRCNSVRLPWP